jgi:hypothetical protein
MVQGLIDVSSRQCVTNPSVYLEVKAQLRSPPNETALIVWPPGTFTKPVTNVRKAPASRDTELDDTVVRNECR